MTQKLLVVRVKKDSYGNVTDVMLNNGEVMPINKALLMSKNGIVEDIIVKHGENGAEYYRAHPTHIGEDSFEHIPQF